MANVVTFMLPEIEIYENHVKDALRSILHTIIVNRSIGPLHTRMMPCELFGLNYATTNHPDEKQNVDSAIGRFQTIITRSNNNLIKDCFLLEFYETKIESTFLGVSTRTKKLLWEQWKIPLRIHRKNDDNYTNRNRGRRMSMEDNNNNMTTNNNTTRTRRRGNSEPAITLTPGQTILQEREQILKSEEKVQNGIFYVIDAVNRRVDHLPKRKLTALKDAKTYDYSIKLHSELTEAKASLKPLMTSLSFRF